MSLSPTVTHSLGWPFTVGGADLGNVLDHFLDARPEPPRLLGLGEPTHGCEAFPLLRNHALRHLVEQHGYRSIAIESDCIAGLIVNDYVTTGEGDFDAVMATGFSHNFGELAANAELVRWLRAVNAERDPADHVRFYGFDGPLEMSHAASPRQALTEVHRYLTAHLEPARVPHAFDTIDSLIGDDSAWTNPASVLDHTQSVGGSAQARELRVITDDLIGLLESEAPGLAAATSPETYDRTYLFARSAQGLLRYHAVLAEPGTNAERMTRASAVRNGMMAANLLAIASAESWRGPTLVFAHNVHLQRNLSHLRFTFGDMDVRWWGAGAIAANRLGTGCAVIASDLGTSPGLNLPELDPNSLHGMLAEATVDSALYPADRLIEALREQPNPVPPRDTGDEFRYIPIDPTNLSGIDAIAFFRNAGTS